MEFADGADYNTILVIRLIGIPESRVLVATQDAMVNMVVP
jgi:hypothetical protein